jgi:hypothetical protein
MKNTKRAFLFHLLILICLGFLACQKSQRSDQNSEVVQMTVANHKEACSGSAPMECLLVQKKGFQDWELFYNQIEGFQYEPGFIYQLEVRIEPISNPLQDGASARYILIRVISKSPAP